MTQHPDAGQHCTMVTQLPAVAQVGASRSLLQPTPQDVVVRTDADIGPLYASLQYPQVVQGLAEHAATTSTAGAGLGTLVSLRAQGVAGNAICEVGELPDAPPNGMGQAPAHCVVPNACMRAPASTMLWTPGKLPEIETAPRLYALSATAHL